MSESDCSQQWPTQDYILIKRGNRQCGQTVGLVHTCIIRCRVSFWINTSLEIHHHYYHPGFARILSTDSLLCVIPCSQIHPAKPHSVLHRCYKMIFHCAVLWLGCPWCITQVLVVTRMLKWLVLGEWFCTFLILTFSFLRTTTTAWALLWWWLLVNCWWFPISW